MSLLLEVQYMETYVFKNIDMYFSHLKNNGNCSVAFTLNSPPQKKCHISNNVINLISYQFNYSTLTTFSGNLQCHVPTLCYRFIIILISNNVIYIAIYLVILSYNFWFSNMH